MLTKKRKATKLTRLLLILITLTFASCRCSIEFIPKADNSGDTTIQATAHMWQGQYEYLSIDIEIKRTDSFYVKDIQVTPLQRGNKFLPNFNQYEMYSYYFEKEDTQGRPLWQTYRAKTFDQLPTHNRQTNKADHFIKYTAFYQSDEQIKFEEFSADIIVTLIDKSGQEITHKKKIDFYGEQNCRFSVH